MRQRLKKFLGFGVVWVSLSLLLAAKVTAEGPEKKSSPEESLKYSLPGSGLLPQDSWGTMIPSNNAGAFQSALEADPEIAALFKTSTLTNPGVYPFQVDPISAFVAAGLTLAVQSYLETKAETGQGRINVDAIWLLLNSTDFYAGVLGSGVAAYTKRSVQDGLGFVAKKAAPNLVKKLSKSALVRIFNNIIGGFSYTLAVSSGFQYFTYFWQVSTAGVDNVNTVSDLMNKAAGHDVRAVLQNLMNNVVDPNLQKEIASSIYNHQILTFEFISMNVGLYLGLVAGDLIAKKVTKKTPANKKQVWVKRLQTYFARVLGGTTFGVAVTLIPRSFKVSINKALLDYKISRYEDKLEADVNRLLAGLEHQTYPPEHRPGVGSFFMSQMNLGDDIDRINRRVKMLTSFQLQRLFVYEEPQEAMDQVVSYQSQVIQVLEDALDKVDSTNWMVGITGDGVRGMDIDEIDRAYWKDLNRDRYRQHYSIMLEVAIERFEESYDQINNFIAHNLSFRQEVEADDFK